jgi:hypothetical protein
MGNNNSNSNTRLKANRIEVQGFGEDGGGPRKSRNGGNNKDDRIRWFNTLEWELAGTGNIIRDKSRYNLTLIRTPTLTKVETRTNIQLRGTCTRPYRVVRRENITARLRETRWHIIPGIIITYPRSIMSIATGINIIIVPREEVLNMDIPVITTTIVTTTTISRIMIARTILTLTLRVAAPTWRMKVKVIPCNPNRKIASGSCFESLGSVRLLCACNIDRWIVACISARPVACSESIFERSSRGGRDLGGHATGYSA